MRRCDQHQYGRQAGKNDADHRCRRNRAWQQGLGKSQKRSAERVTHHTERAAERNVRLALEPLNPMFDGSRTVLITVREAQSRVLNYCFCDWLEDTRHMLLDRGLMGDGVDDLKAIWAAV